MFSVNFPFIYTKRGNLLLNTANCSGRSRPSDTGGGGGHPDPEIRGGAPVSKINFFGPSSLVSEKK